MATAYNATIAYNTGGGLKYTGTYKSPELWAERGLQWNLNRVIGYLDASNNVTIDAQGAANIWAGTVGLDLLGALNYKAGTSGLGLNGVLNVLGGTPTFLDSDGASQWL